MSQTTRRVQYYVLLIYAVECVDIELNGEVSFDLKISNLDLDTVKELDPGYSAQEFVPKDENNDEESLSVKVVRAKRPKSVTAAPVVECQYQYPEREQVDALLSNMMNQLTRMFIRVHEIMQEEDSRRKQDTRFRVVDKKDTGFFEHIYSNMTNEYRQFYNHTAQRVDRTARDPCQHQQEIKQIWKDLLERSLASIRKATLQCVNEYFRAQNMSAEAKTRNRIDLFLLKELGTIRSSQLDLLCDKFQLCYNEFL